MDQSYKKLMSIKGVDELKRVVRKWQKLSDNIHKTGTERLNILPDMLWVSDNGINKTELLSYMGDYLYSLDNLMSFSGDKRFIEFYLGYEENGTFEEMKRFRYDLNNVRGFKNYYEGIVYVDISEWVRHLEDKRFIAFLEFLATNSDTWLIVLNINNDSPKKVTQVEGVISTYLRIEKIRLNLPKNADLLDYAENILSDYGFTLTDGAKKLLMKSLAKMRMSKKFDGLNSVRYMCSDIIYTSLSNKSSNLFSLTAKDLEAFSADSDYVNRIIENYEKKHKVVGFLGGENND